MNIIRFLNDNILWGIPMITLMIFCGVYLTIVTRGLIFRKFNVVMRHTGKTLFSKKASSDTEGTISPFQAVSTALAATVGTGNIVGIAIAIKVGGPGAIFWMWIAALFGMVVKYSEVTLAFLYREKNSKGEFVGGPMYYIKNGTKKNKLAVFFCIAAVLCSIGVGNMVQSNSLVNGIFQTFSIGKTISGIFVTILVALVLIGGIKRIASVAEILVPFMALAYIIGAIFVILVNAERIPNAIASIFDGALNGTAAVGGFSGATFMYAVRIGTARGILTNEAGLGSAPIAHACANNYHPARQGLWGAFEVFFDTIVMCTITALVILTSGLWTGNESGYWISQLAFENAFNYGSYVVTIGLVLFAFATIIAWYYYGEKSIEFLFGAMGVKIYRTVYIFAVFLGAVTNNELIWEMADTLNAMMSIPNLIALIILAPIVGRLTKDFIKNEREEDNRGRSFENFKNI